MNFSKTSTFLIFFFLTSLLYGQTANFQWVRHNAGTEANINVDKMLVDSQGSIYTIGNFTGDNGYSHADFDPTDGEFILDSLGLGDIYIQKLTATGAFGWARVVGSPEDEGIASHKETFLIDSSGNLIITGTFQSTIDFDSDTATTTDRLTANGENDLFVLKLAADGTFGWVKSFGSSVSDESPSLALDSQGNIFVAGNFNGIVDFDPDASSTYNLESNGQSDAYVLKLASDGSFVWAHNFGGSENDEVVPIVLDPDENIILAGTFRGTVDFDPGAVHDDDTFTAGIRLDGGDDQTDVYVIKYSQSTLSANTPGPQQRIVAYPNPSQGDITIDLGVNQDSVQLRVFNMFGQVVAETTHTQVSEIPLTIAGATGLYWVEVETSDSKAVFSLVKK